jgi:hypothetical protein
MGGKILLQTLSKFKTLTKFAKDWTPIAIGSGSEVDEKTKTFAPKKKHYPFDQCFHYDYLLKITFSCSKTRINVVRLVNSFNLEAPTYVQVLLMPPRISFRVTMTSPLKGT